MHEIAIRVRLQQRERFTLTEYERFVGSVASLSALIAWLPTPDARLVLRGRGADPVRVETVSYGDSSEILVVLDQRTPAAEKAATVVAALLQNVGPDGLAEDAAGVAGELDRLDRAAPRGRTAAERSLRAFLEGARADVVARRTTARVRAASALVRLAEDGAVVTVERIEDALDPILEETVVEALPVTGAEVAVGAPDAGGQPLAVEQDAPVLTEKSQKSKGSKPKGKGSAKSDGKSAADDVKAGADSGDGKKAAKSGKGDKKSKKKDKKKSKKK